MVGVLGVIGLAALFVVPWIGAAALAAAVVLGIVMLFATGTRAAEGVEREEPETPHMPGPGNPESGVD
jgi:hypothetical protein